ncbi:MAG TPA: hypothetical protein VHW02_06360 [Rhizomicrobium sp.]|jgi:hypothetical protein|nr:hypothetical protein [Rhizomicrobium sp.]
MKFSDETIVRLFGHEEAEREDPNRLIEYFVKNDVYTRVRADLRLRILVGYKGVGKSALFKFCEIEDQRNDIASVWIKLDDVANVAQDQRDLNAKIKEWKDTIQEIVFRKVAEEFGHLPSESDNEIVRYGSGFLQSLISLANKRLGTVADPTKRALVNGFLKKKRLVVYLDDLDRGWTGSEADTVRIAALLNAVRDIVADTEGVYFRVALRSDVYNIVRRRDSNADKIEGDTIWLQWNNDDIFRVLVRRVATFEGKGGELAAFGNIDQPRLAKYLDGVFDPKYSGIGLWDNRAMYHVVLSFVRAKPRDIVLFCSGAARIAEKNKHGIIKSSDVAASLKGYCQGRVNDIINEFRSELPDIERLIYGMKASAREIKERKGNKYTTAELVEKLKDIISQGKFVFFNGRVASPNDLIRFLFRVTFITARKKLPSGLIERKYFDEAQHLAVQSADFGYSWEVHPAYRWALDQEGQVDLFREVEPTDFSDIK